MRDCLKKAQARYNEKTRTFLLKFNIENDKDVILKLESVSNKINYIRQLIKKDIEQG